MHRIIRVWPELACTGKGNPRPQPSSIPPDQSPIYLPSERKRMWPQGHLDERSTHSLSPQPACSKSSPKFRHTSEQWIRESNLRARLLLSSKSLFNFQAEILLLIPEGTLYSRDTEHNAITHRGNTPSRAWSHHSPFSHSSSPIILSMNVCTWCSLSHLGWDSKPGPPRGICDSFLCMALT